MKLKQKRTKATQKILYILQPFIIYLIAKTFAMLLLSEACNFFFEEELRIKLASPVNALASIFGVAFVMKDFLIEVAITGEIDIDAPGITRFYKWISNGVKQNTKKVLPLVLCAILAMTSSMALNILVDMIQVSSTKFENVTTIQYSVPIWLGIILYGIVSPWVEEIVFRGLIYNRMKRYYNLVPCVIVTAIMFGGFHANIPQFIFGTIMGILIALTYEWTGTFEAPIIFHTVANIFAFLVTNLLNGSKVFVTPVYLIIFLVISIGLIFAIRYSCKKHNRIK